MRNTHWFLWTLALIGLSFAPLSHAQSAPPEDFGVLVMAHGGRAEWNQGVLDAVEPLHKDYKLEVAFGMADPATIQEAVSKLEARGVRKIGVVRLFISGESWYERTEQILGVAEGAPPRPVEPAHAEHGEHSEHGDAHGSGGGHGHHSMALWRIETKAAFAMSKQGLAEAPAMGQVLADRAKALSKQPEQEDVLILAHGPADDAENKRWIAHLDARAEVVRQALPFRRVEVQTLREDWPDKREKAEQRIRAFVERASEKDGRAIVIPFRVQGFGPYARVLEGLDYASDGVGLIPHPNVTRWIAEQIAALQAGPFRGTTAAPHDHQHHQHSDAMDGKFEQDRKAILAMAGEYKIKFRFDETVAIEPGYELHEPYRSRATELIEVIEDTGTRISLQHILVLKPSEAGGDPIVVKHWRQDWTYEDTEMVEFRGRSHWERVTLSPDQVKGTWTQAVYQVDDAPRYESYGTWAHTGGSSAWESQDTWRPLPRREYTHREDYHVIVGRNRHVLTADGWAHEQDNRKLVLNEDGAPARILCHETGLNTYSRADDADLTAGREYWQNTQAYWQDVRDIWANLLARDSVTIKAEADGEPLLSLVFDQGNEISEKGKYDRESGRAWINETLSKYVEQ